MANKITRQSKLTFGRHKGRKISTCETSYLKWMADKLSDSDLCLWAQVAQTELDVREKEGTLADAHLSLEEQANELLRKAGFKP